MKSKNPTQKDPNELILESLIRFKPYLTDKEYHSLLGSLQKVQHPAVRPNLLKVDGEKAFETWSKKYDWIYRGIPFTKFSRKVIHSNTSISQTIEHKLGQYYIQDVSSLLPIAMFHFENNSSKFILDLAASPGGKTTQIIDQTYDKSFIIANDSSYNRMQALRVVLQNWGATNFMTTNFPGEKFGLWFPELFDLVLLDAPCSMENLIHSPTHPLRPITSNERNRLSSRQTALLVSAFSALKPGGQLIYSTCTLAPEEDEAVLNTLIDLYKNNCQIEKVTKLGISAPAFTTFEGEHFHPSIVNAFRLWPHIVDSSGFFAAKISKLNSVDKIQEHHPSRPFSATALKILDKSEVKQIESHFSILYGLSVEDILDKYNLRLYRRENLIYLIPQAYVDYFSDLPYFNIGMPGAKEIKGTFFPSFEFVNRFANLFSNGILRLTIEQTHSWIKGKDLQNNGKKEFPYGTIIVIKDADGNYVGCGKYLSNRIRNLLPSRIF